MNNSQINKEKAFYDKWTVIRNKSRIGYMLSRGVVFWIVIYAIWLLATYLFDKEKFASDTFALRILYYGGIYFILGIVFSNRLWNSKEKRYAILQKFSKQQ